MQHRFRKAFPLIHSRLQIETIVNAFSHNQISNYMFNFSELISITIQYYFKKMNSELSNYSKMVNITQKNLLKIVCSIWRQYRNYNFPFTSFKFNIDMVPNICPDIQKLLNWIVIKLNIFPTKFKEISTSLFFMQGAIKNSIGLLNSLEIKTENDIISYSALVNLIRVIGFIEI